MPTKDTEKINAAVYIDGKRMEGINVNKLSEKKKRNNDLISREQTMRAVSEIMADILVSAFAGKETHFDELCQRLKKRLQSLPAAYIEGTGNQATESGRAGNRKAYSFNKERYFGAYDTEKKALDEAYVEIAHIQKYDPEHVPDFVYLGTCEFFKPSLSGSGWDIIEAIVNQADDEGYGEWSDNYLSDAPDWQVKELEEGLEKAFQEWIHQYNHHADFYKVNSYAVYRYDKEKHELKEVEKQGEGNNEYERK